MWKVWKYSWSMLWIMLMYAHSEYTHVIRPVALRPVERRATRCTCVCARRAMRSLYEILYIMYIWVFDDIVVLSSNNDAIYRQLLSSALSSLVHNTRDIVCCHFTLIAKQQIIYWETPKSRRPVLFFVTHRYYSLDQQSIWYMMSTLYRCTGTCTLYQCVMVILQITAKKAIPPILQQIRHNYLSRQYGNY